MFVEKKMCRLCHGAALERFFDLGEQPPANSFLAPKDFDSEKYFPLCVARCRNPECGFVQLVHVVDPEILFSGYLYVSSTSPVFVKHFEEYAKTMDVRLHLRGAFTLDIGSNDGVLVKPLKELGALALGVDPAREIAERATSEGYETITGYFSESYAKELAAARGKAKLITANNVFAHIDDLDDVVRGVRTLLSQSGLFVIEAPYLLDYLEQKLFDTTYHEHLSYLAIRPLQAFFTRHDMHIVDVMRVNTHGGSVRIMVAHLDSPHTPAPVVGSMIREEEEKGLHESAVYHQFAQDVLENKNKLRELLIGLKQKGAKIAGYGAPAKGNTLLNFIQIGRETLEYIVDDNPLKQGLYSPGMHIPVVSRVHMEKRPPDYLLILAWNFATSIIEKNTQFQVNGGKFIIPVPMPRIV